MWAFGGAAPRLQPDCRPNRCLLCRPGLRRGQSLGSDKVAAGVGLLAGHRVALGSSVCSPQHAIPAYPDDNLMKAGNSLTVQAQVQILPLPTSRGRIAFKREPNLAACTVVSPMPAASARRTDR